MHVITYNIQYGKGRDGRYDIDRTADALISADIIGLQEVEAYWERSGNIHQVQRITDRLGGYHAVFGATVDIHKSLEGREVRRQFGNAILSRWPIITTRTFLFPKLGPANGHSIQRGLTEATIDTPIGLLRVYTSHFSHLCDEERMEHARITLDVHRRAVVEGPVSGGDHRDISWLEELPPSVPSEAILMGDLNLTPDGPVYPVLVGPTSPQYGRLIQPDCFVDAWTAAGHAEDSGPTFYTDWMAKTGWRVDYMLVTPGLKDRVKSAEVLTADASDHQPLAVTFG
ncbi:endonuclease/exonuclease/phosphatase family protein [Sinorhizobium chiapasense]|uniref:Endonuclease/exonuclease/phosphatase family protein n=1 Tax=Sinorhizobium chiapasense TaxID=501572 RepID=A0ABZ2BFC8_9HYPH